jgi:ribulose-phosphate 3-epimerase
MDGSFVPNFALGTNDVGAVRSLTDKEIDIHLMVENADVKVNYFLGLGADRICVHYESTKHLDRTIRLIKQNGIKGGIAVNPSTSIVTIEDILGYVDYVLIMSVNPGFASQKYIDYITDKIKRLVTLREQKNLDFTIEVDGSMSEENISMLQGIGADEYVLGTAALFNKPEDYRSIIERILLKNNRNFNGISEKAQAIKK